MTRVVSFLSGVAVILTASGAAAQMPASPRTDPGELRRQIYLMEGALARAVNSGAARLNQEIRAVVPDLVVLAGESNARGFHLENYGVFFDVEVPVLRQSMMWSLRTMLDNDDQSATNALASLRTYVAQSSGPERAAAENSLRLLEAQLRPFGQPRRPLPGLPGSVAATAALPGTPAAPAASKPPVNSLLLTDPNKAYTDAVLLALKETMVEWSLPMVTALGPEEYLIVAARDNERRDQLAPQNPFEEVSTMILRIKASDLAAYRAGKIDRDEAMKRVEVKEF
jgi:hypothetical protein